MFESSKRVAPWRAIVSKAATQAGDDAGLMEPLQPPYKVSVWFFIEKPRSTRAAHPVAPTVGDVDKLARAVCDALKTGGLIEDDRFVIKLVAEKAWAVGEKPGAIIRVAEVAA